MKKYKLMTVSELAKYLASKIDIKNPANKLFAECDFAIAEISEERSDTDLEGIADDTSGWYGIHSINGGFDSDCLFLMADYYGGGSHQFTSIYDGMTYERIEKAIKNIILGSLRVCECSVYSSTILIVEFR